MKVWPVSSFFSIFVVTLLLASSVYAQSSRRANTWFSPYNEPMYLAEVTPEGGGERQWRLVPSFSRFDPQPGFVRNFIGGPYKNRMEVELDRNRLAGERQPVNLTRIDIYDGKNNRSGGFLLGAKPVLIVGDKTTFGGTVNADFRPRNPEFFPLPFEFDDYIDHVSNLMETAKNFRERNSGNSGRSEQTDPARNPLSAGTVSDAMQAIPPYKTSINLSVDVTCPGNGASIFGLGNQNGDFVFQNEITVTYDRRLGGDLDIVATGDRVYRIPGRTDELGIFHADLTHQGVRLDIDGIAVEAFPIGKKLVGHGEAAIRMSDGHCTVNWKIL